MTVMCAYRWEYSIVERMFQGAWKLGGPRPKLRKVYKIVEPWAFLSAYVDYK
jgi:hypothetical protein